MENFLAFKKVQMCTIVWTLLIVFGLFIIPNETEAMTVSPPVIELEIGPGKNATKMIRLYNELDIPTSLFIELRGVDQTVHAETGAPTILPNTETLEPPLSWIELPYRTVALNPRSSTDIPLKITIPAVAEPGGYYGALMVSSQALDNYDGVQVVGKTVIMLLLTVTGDTIRKGAITEFGAVPTDSLFSSQPNGFFVRIQNEGTVHFKPTGMIDINGIFGLKKSLTVNNEERSVLPGWTRRFDASWSNQKLRGGFLGEWQRFGFGRYTAALAITIGKENLTEQFVYWVIPWRTIILLVIFMVSIITLRRKVNKRF